VYETLRARTPRAIAMEREKTEMAVSFQYRRRLRAGRKGEIIAGPLWHVEGQRDTMQNQGLQESTGVIGSDGVSGDARPAQDAEGWLNVQAIIREAPPVVRRFHERSSIR
jgi:hypothetical protein